MLFLASMGETGLTHDIFFEFSLGPFKVVEAEEGCLVECPTWLPETREPEKKTRESRHRAGQI